MKRLFKDFITSVKAQMSPEALSYKNFITEKTFIDGRNFSFVDHEFQEYIIDVIESNPGCIFSIKKASQVGLSELLNRVLLARMAIRPRTSCLVSFPSIKMSQEVLKTRIAGVINESPELSSLIDRNNDSASLKAFKNGSIMYALSGSGNSDTSLLNRPIAVVLIDEQDKQSTKITTGFESRMKHTPMQDRLWVNISTPTADGIGIDAEIKDSRFVHTPWVKCPCGHEFIPDFFSDIVIPGFTKPIAQLTKIDASKLNIGNSYLACPDCGGKINNKNKETVWKITENKDSFIWEDPNNPDRKFCKIGIELDPFVAMGFVPIQNLVSAFLKYESSSEFLNQELGKVADKSASSISQASIKFVNDNPSGAHIFSLDLGKKCHFLHGIMKPDTTVHVSEAHIVNLSELEAFLEEQHSRFVFSAGVTDSQPYTDLVYRLIKKYPRLFSANYVVPNPPVPEAYKIKMVDKNNETVRQVNINKPLVMDSFAGSLLDFYTFQTGPLDNTIVKHFTDMRRVRDYRFEEMIYSWIKSSKGDDHFWHCGVYLYMAAKLALTGLSASCSVPIVVKKINIERARAERIKR